MGQLIQDILGVAPWVVITSIGTWVFAARKHYKTRSREAIARSERLEIHKDGLAFELVRGARQELIATRVEMDELHLEVRKLRKMEKHFFHFQQALDHLDALLSAESADARALAERNARAFLNRMRRLDEAKGTIANEMQRAESEAEIAQRDMDEIRRLMGEEDDDNPA